uniref:Uncharacterized protein n=1 Tax=Rhipicephalus microplus TaxID=6941 RepID=A0A6G5AEN2_RHIMP
MTAADVTEVADMNHFVRLSCSACKFLLCKRQDTTLLSQIIYHTFIMKPIVSSNLYIKTTSRFYFLIRMLIIVTVIVSCGQHKKLCSHCVSSGCNAKVVFTPMES